MNRIILFLSLTIMFLCSCTGMYDNIEEYWDRGEIPYIGRPDSAVVYGGKERAKIEWIVNSDPRIEKCIIYWNFRKDSVVVDIDKSKLVDNKFSYMLNSLDEGSYVFELIHIGQEGYPSIAHEVIGEVYGEKYQSNLTPRKITDFEWVGSDLRLSLGIDDSNYCLFKYTTVDGSEKEVRCSIEETEVILDNCSPASQIEYSTVYIPEENALDLFVIDNVYYLPQMFDRAGWTAVAVGKEGFDVDEQPGYEAWRILDGDFGTCYHSPWSPYSPYPHTIVVDMQNVKSVKEIEVCSHADIRTVSLEISEDAQNWTLVGVAEFDGAAQRRTIKLSESKQARYIRLVGTSSYDSSRQFTSIQELFVYGYK